MSCKYYSLRNRKRCVIYVLLILTVIIVEHFIPESQPQNTLHILDEIPLLVTKMWKEYHGDELQLLSQMNLTFPPNVLAKIETIGIVYTRYYEGGIERVISLQIPILLDLGFHVVLFTDIIDIEKEYPLDGRVVRIKLPGSMVDGRAQALYDAVRALNVELIIHHTHYSDLLLFDVLICKLLGRKVIIVRHGTILNSILANDPRAGVYHHLFSYSDLVLSLSRMEVAYLKTMGVSARYFPNPIQFPNVTHNYSAKGGIILWVGRLDLLDKNYYAALEIMKLVAETHPSARLVIVGPEYGYNSGYRVRQFISKHKLQNNIQWVGAVDDISYWYRKARIHLVTSSYESFSMVILESKSFGIPLVLYSLPYLDLLETGQGYISVPQFDARAAAMAIGKLLDNETLCLQLSAEARKSLEPFKKFDQKAEWKRLVDEIQQNNINRSTTDCVQAAPLRTLFETLFSHYHPFQQHMKRIERTQ